MKNIAFVFAFIKYLWFKAFEKCLLHEKKKAASNWINWKKVINFLIYSLFIVGIELSSVGNIDLYVCGKWYRDKETRQRIWF